MGSLTIFGVLSYNTDADIIWEVRLCAFNRQLYLRDEQLKTGDLLTVFSDKARKTVIWDGTINLVKPDVSEIIRTQASPNLERSVQKDVPLDKWWEMFYHHQQAILVRKF